jgi:NitT/TauT family transport system substrate-binding protein
MKKLLALIFVIILAVSTGCAKKEVQQETKPLRIGILPIEDNLPFFVAEKDDLFTKSGIKVQLIPFESARERDTAMQAGQLDVEVADMVAVALLKKGGTDVKIASIGLGSTPQEGRFVLLASPASTAKTVADLKGKTIAISENTIIEYLTDEIFKLHNVTPVEIKKMNIPAIPVRLEALTNNKLDAAVLPDPLASLAEKQGAKVIFDDTKSLTNLSQTVILVSNKSIIDNKEAIKNLLAIYQQAGEALTANPETYRLLALEKARIPKPIQASYKLPTFSKLQLPTADEFTRVINWMVEKKLLANPFTYSELVDETLLK